MLINDTLNGQWINLPQVRMNENIAKPTELLPRDLGKTGLQVIRRCCVDSESVCRLRTVAP